MTVALNNYKECIVTWCDKSTSCCLWMITKRNAKEMNRRIVAPDEIPINPMFVWLAWLLDGLRLEIC